MALKIKRIEQTCFACPSQWEGETEDGHDFYIRYRWGVLRLDIDGVTAESFGLGDGLDGVLSTEDMLRHLSHVIAPE